MTTSSDYAGASCGRPGWRHIPRPPPRRRPGAGPLLTLVNGVLAGVGSVYLGTHSVLITVVAGVTAILLAAMAMFLR